MTRARVCLPGLLMLLAACESDVARAERLRREEAVACLLVDIEANGGAARATAAQRAACDVARRNYHRFMSGR